MNVRSLRFRITAWYAGLMAGDLLIFGVSVYLGLERYLYGNAQRALAADCRTIGTQMLSQHPFKTPDWLETEIEEDYAPEINNHFIRVTQIGAGVVYVTGAPKDGSFDPNRIPLSSSDQERSRKMGLEGNRLLVEELAFTAPANAIKYTLDGGEVEMRVHRTADTAVLEVSDNGAGIPDYALPHVFERFYRADKARSRESGGAGLGLAIVKAICTAHGAELGVTSGEGQGSGFS